MLPPDLQHTGFPPVAWQSEGVSAESLPQLSSGGQIVKGRSLEFFRKVFSEQPGILREWLTSVDRAHAEGDQVMNFAVPQCQWDGAVILTTSIPAMRPTRRRTLRNSSEEESHMDSKQLFNDKSDLGCGVDLRPDGQKLGC